MKKTLLGNKCVKIDSQYYLKCYWLSRACTAFSGNTLVEREPWISLV